MPGCIWREVAHPFTSHIGQPQALVALTQFETAAHTGVENGAEVFFSLVGICDVELGAHKFERIGIFASQILCGEVVVRRLETSLITGLRTVRKGVPLLCNVSV